MKTLSIYNKLIIYFLLVSLLPLIGLGYLSYHQLNGVIRENSLRLLSLIAVETAYKIEEMIRSRRAEIQAWSRLPMFIEALDKKAAAKRPEINAIFDQWMAYYPMYSLLLLVDADHRVFAVNSVTAQGQPLSTGNLIGNQISEGPWFSEAAQTGFYMSGFRHSSLLSHIMGNQGNSMSLSMPIRDAADNICGYFIAYLNWNYVQDILDVAQAAHAQDLAGLLFMLDLDSNRFIAHRNPKLYGEPYPLRVDLKSTVERNPAGILNVDWPEPKTIGYAQVSGMRAGESQPWVVVVEAPDEVIYRQAKFLRVLFMTLTILAVLAIIIIVYFISRRFSDPLLQLVNGAQAIAAGNMNVEMPVKSVDEIGILANTFNQMSDALRERDEELRRTNQQLEEANRLKSEFLANVSHELRTPMNSILGFTTLVLQRTGDSLPEQQRNNLIKVRKNTLQLLKLLNSILDLSKIEAGSMDVAVEEFSLASLMDGCHHTILPLLEGRPIELSAAASDRSLVLYTDRNKLQQIIINLLGNAAKFTEKGYLRTGYVVVNDPGFSGAEKGPGPWVRIWVEDSGIGVHEKDLENIFNEFRQVDGSPSRKYGGTGLGLSISKKLAKLLGGDILVKSELGFGSTFTVVIPVRHEMAQPLVRNEYEHPLPPARAVEDNGTPEPAAAASGSGGESD
ncbi:MAG: HAMP domain-containing protein [Myxococcales bacterium]|nr:HAMP domain-containing protein [Myxococcales bacterium]